MTIDSVRTSNVGQVQQDQHSETEGTKGGGGKPPKELTKGQKFGQQMKRDFGFMGHLLGGSFKGVSSLAKSHQRGVELMKTKNERLEHLKGHIPQVLTQLEEKDSEVATCVRNLLDSDHTLSDRSREAIFKHFEKVVDGQHNLNEPNSLRTLLRDHPELKAPLEKALREHEALRNDLGKSVDEQRMLTKLTHGKLAGKVVRTGLLALASPFISAFTTVMVAPILPIWTGVALLRAGVYAETGRTLGTPNQDIREKLKDKVNNEL